jgi:hypothetical protein
VQQIQFLNRKDDILQANNFFMEKAEFEYLKAPRDPKVFANCYLCGKDIYLFEKESDLCKITGKGTLCERCIKKIY